MSFKKLKVSIAKLLIPFLYFILRLLKANTRMVNYLDGKKIISNNSYDFQKNIETLLDKKKLVGLDVGAQGGFNSDNFFPKKYNKYFESILVDPFKDSLENKQGNHIINKGLWSSKTSKNFYVLNKRPESSSMYEPDKQALSIYGFKKKDFHLFDITSVETVECETISTCLKNININKLDYLKIDTQGAELEILKGLGNFRPLIIKCEVQVFPMYKNQPKWTEVLNFLNELGYMVCEWKKIGFHVTRTPVEMDMLFIPDFLKETGKEMIRNKKGEFICLMMITGQIELLKKAFNILSLELPEFLAQTEDKYFN